MRIADVTPDLSFVDNIPLTPALSLKGRGGSFLLSFPRTRESSVVVFTIENIKTLDPRLKMSRMTDKDKNKNPGSPIESGMTAR